MVSKLSPIFYKTTVVFIDDDMEFLNVLSDSISGALNYKPFDSPLKALEYINSLDASSRVATKNVYANVSEKKGDTNKYNEISVIVVDYDMPGMDGITLSTEIKDPSVRKILLTGEATPIEVIEAFNNGEIDYFLDKKTPNLVSRLNDTIFEMQKLYFQQGLEWKALAKQPYSNLFLDRAFSKYFDDLCRQFDVKEHYFDSTRSSFTLCLDELEMTLIVADDKLITEHISIILDEDGPAEWIKKLKARKYVPYFISDDGFYTPEKQGNINPLHLAERVCGENNYYCALLRTLPIPTVEKNRGRLH